MPPRQYQPDRIVPMQPRKTVAITPQAIPLNAKLHSITRASELLNEQFDGGFSTTSIRRLILNGEWVEGVHCFKVGRRYKIYLQAVLEWQLRR